MMNYHIDVNSFGFEFLKMDKFVTKIYNFQPANNNKVYPGKTSISSGKCWLEDETSF